MAMRDSVEVEREVREALDGELNEALGSELDREIHSKASGALNQELSSKASGALNQELSGECGSISPLIITLFSILMIFIFLISNVASAYVARRDLINRVESALSVSAQELDELTYYYASPLTDFITEIGIRENQVRVPIDCFNARKTFSKILQTATTSYYTELEAGSPITGVKPTKRYEIEISNFSCDGYELTATVAETRDLPFQVRIFDLTRFTNEVSASTSSFLLTESR